MTFYRARARARHDSTGKLKKEIILLKNSRAAAAHFRLLFFVRVSLLVRAAAVDQSSGSTMKCRGASKREDGSAGGGGARIDAMPGHAVDYCVMGENGGGSVVDGEFLRDEIIMRRGGGRWDLVLAASRI